VDRNAAPTEITSFWAPIPGGNDAREMATRYRSEAKQSAEKVPQNFFYQTERGDLTSFIPQPSLQGHRQAIGQAGVTVELRVDLDRVGAGAKPDVPRYGHLNRRVVLQIDVAHGKGDAADEHGDNAAGI
jgi:hypothetical protein